MRRSTVVGFIVFVAALAAAPAAHAASNITVVAGTVLVNNSGPPNFTPTGSDSRIGVDHINTQLAANGNVILDTTSAAGDPGIITINAPISAGAAIGDLVLDADANIDMNSTIAIPAASVSMTALTGVQLDGLGAASLSVTAGDPITQAASTAVVVNANASFTTNTADDVVLSNPANNFVGTFSIPQAAGVSVTDSNALSLGSVAANATLNVTTSGAITQTAGTVTSTSGVFSAGAANDITLNSATNDFNQLTITSGRNVLLTDSTGLTLSGGTVSGTFGLTALNGNITQIAPLTVQGNATLSAAGSNIDLSQVNDFTAVTASALSVALGEDNDISLGNVSATSGLLSVTADGDIGVTAGATLAAGGTLRLTADDEFPAPPGIGSGGIGVSPNAVLTGGGAIRLFGGHRSDNSIAANATFNGSTFTPGPLFVNSLREQWGAYSPGGTATAPFTFFYKDVDTADPQIAITSPASGATYQQGQSVSAAYSCADPGGSGITNCAGPVAAGAAVDTSTPGQKSFKVDATDAVGRQATTTVAYTVAPATAAKDPKCQKLGKKLGRQKDRVRKLRGRAKQAYIENNIKDTRKRQKKLAC